MVPDVLPFRPVRALEAPVDGVVEAAVTSELGEGKSVQRVWDARRRLVREARALDRPSGHLVRVETESADVVGAKDTLARKLWMQEVRAPFDLCAVPAREPVGPLQADVAKRSGVVAPDPDSAVGHDPCLPGGAMGYAKAKYPRRLCPGFV